MVTEKPWQVSFHGSESALVGLMIPSVAEVEHEVIVLVAVLEVVAVEAFDLVFSK